MGPLSVVATSLWLILVGISWVGWSGTHTKFLGVCALIAAAIILIDTFWYGSGPRFTNWRGNNARTARAR